MKKRLFVIALSLMPMLCSAQTKSDINSDMPITWLGVDFSQLKFFVDTLNVKGDPYKGVPTNKELRDTYFEAWNNIFISEKRKYDIASAVWRRSVAYAIDVTRCANENLQHVHFVTNDKSQWGALKKKKIAEIIGNYDFKGNKGLGLMFIVDGMSKCEKQCSIWVVFANMNNGTLIDAGHYIYQPSGFGIRNQYANCFYRTLKEMRRTFSDIYYSPIAD